MELDLDSILSDLDKMEVDHKDPKLRATLNALIDTNSLYDAMIPQSEIKGYLTGMVCFISRIPAQVLSKGSRVLDVGSGQGRLLLALKRSFGTECYGIDKYTYATTGGRLLWTIQNDHDLRVLSPFDFEKVPLPYPDAYFDLITSQQVFEHLHDTPKLVFEEIYRTLKPGGFFVMDTPNHTCWINHIKMMRGESVHFDLKKYYNHEFSTGPRGEYFGHTREFTIDELAAMLQWAGFEIVSAETTMYAPGGDLVDVINHYLHEIKSLLQAEYGADLVIAPREQLASAADKAGRLLNTAILVATRK